MCHNTYRTQPMSHDDALALVQWFGDGLNKYFDKEFDRNRVEGNSSTRGFYFFYDLRNDEIVLVKNWINCNCNNKT